MSSPWWPAVDVAEQLVAAADADQRRAAGDRSRELAAVALQVVGDQQLVAILAAAEQEQVDRAASSGSPGRSGCSTSSIPRQAQRWRSTITLPRSA